MIIYEDWKRENNQPQGIGKMFQLVVDEDLTPRHEKKTTKYIVISLFQIRSSVSCKVNWTFTSDTNAHCHIFNYDIHIYVFF